MPRGVPRVPAPGTEEVPVEVRQQAAALLDGAWINQSPDEPQAIVDATQAGGDQDTAASLPETPTGPAQPDRVADALLRHLAALNSKARKVGADRDDLFLAESFRELAEAIIDERGRVRQV